MTVTCDLIKKGPNIAQDMKSFQKAINKAVSPARLKKNRNRWNKKFQGYIRKNAQRSGIVDTDFEKIFELSVVGNKIVISNNAPIIVNRWEYGWEDDIEDEQAGDYASVHTPRYFVRPALEMLIQDIIADIEQDTYSDYERESHMNARSEWFVMNSSEYLSKYSFNKYDGVFNG